MKYTLDQYSKHVGLFLMMFNVFLNVFLNSF